MSQILCIGDIMVDVVVKANIGSKDFKYGSDTKSEIVMRGGGQAANVASWLTQVDIAPFLVARVGADEMGNLLISELDQFGIAHSAKRIPNVKTGMVVVLVDQSGERTMFPDSGANSGLGVSDLPDLSGYKIAFISAYSLINQESRTGVLEIIKKLRSSKIKIVIDPASVGALQSVPIEEVRSWLELADVLVMNEQEAKYITNQPELESAMDTLVKLANHVVVKVGAAGAHAKKINEKSIFESTNVKTAVDSTGAGDAFSAGFLAKYLFFLTQGKPIDLLAAIRAGNELAGKCVAQIGARPLVAAK
jgi:sugar/nucleoside kinase (ribokinase family)